MNYNKAVNIMIRSGGIAVDNNFLSGDVNSLKASRGLVEQYNQARDDCAQTTAEEKRLEKELALNKKNLKDNIESTVKKRRAEVAGKFDDEVDKDQDKIKKIRAKRERAKDKGIKERIAEETADLTAQNKELKKNIRESLKKEKLPGFCGSGFYFTLYYTKGAGEVFICALMIVMMFLVVPAVVYLALPFEKLPDSYNGLAFALTFFVVVLIVFFIYKVIGDKTKNRHFEELKSVRSLRDQIISNKRQISNICRAIKKDKNEEMYELDNFDEQINAINADIDKINSEKEAALKNFDDNVSASVATEIENREMPRINEISDNYNAMVARHAELDETIRQMRLKLSTDYEAYLGEGFTDINKLDELISIMESGSAGTVSEAINQLRTR